MTQILGDMYTLKNVSGLANARVLLSVVIKIRQKNLINCLILEKLPYMKCESYDIGELNVSC